ncbi:MAG TPA: hypothetical protein VH325_11735 [Bryobacteraceae bacterium]|jgi:hypothetical protein|nr:hypothetical protein [Bryobacteraceae bacterium]
MTLQELQAQMDEHQEQYRNDRLVPESDEFESENSPGNECVPDDSSNPSNYHRSGGPRTPEGKAISSQNATTHGCRSKTLILRHEDPAEYEALYKNWRDQYQPSGQAAETLVEQLINNHWFLLRASKRMEQVDFGMPDDVFSWTADQTKIFNTIQRYQTAAQRAFDKSFKAVETYFRDCRRDKIAVEKAELARVKTELQIKKLTPKPEPPPRKRTPLSVIKARMNTPLSEWGKWEEDES